MIISTVPRSRFQLLLVPKYKDIFGIAFYLGKGMLLHCFKLFPSASLLSKNEF